MIRNLSKVKFPLFLLPLVLALFLASCARREYMLPPPGIQTGLASWYGPDFHGKATSSTEIYNMHDMTAAHRTLPFGTMVIVVNLNNGKSVVVRINDRGPFIKGRIIDLSYGAAHMLDMVGEGVVPVKIEVLKTLEPEEREAAFSLQVGAFIDKKNATNLKKKLQRRYREVYISKFVTSNQTYYRVRIRAQSLESAQRIGKELLREGYPVLLIEGQEFKPPGKIV